MPTYCRQFHKRAISHINDVVSRLRTRFGNFLSFHMCKNATSWRHNLRKKTASIYHVWIAVNAENRRFCICEKKNLTLVVFWDQQFLNSFRKMWITSPKARLFTLFWTRLRIVDPKGQLMTDPICLPKLLWGDIVSSIFVT